MDKLIINEKSELRKSLQEKDNGLSFYKRMSMEQSNYIKKLQKEIHRLKLENSVLMEVNSNYRTTFAKLKSYSLNIIDEVSGYE